MKGRLRLRNGMLPDDNERGLTMKRWLGKALLAVSLAAVAGCGSYEPDLTPTKAVAIKVPAELCQDYIDRADDFTTILKKVTTPETAQAQLAAIPDARLKFSAVKQEFDPIPVDQKRQIDLALSGKLNENLTALEKEKDRIKGIVNLPPAFLQALSAPPAPRTTISPLPGDQPAGWASWILSLLLLGIFAACLGTLHPEGLWSNAIRLVNVVTAGLLAMNFYEPVAKYLTSQMDTYTIFWDYLAIWAVFSAAVMVGRTVTSTLSTVKVRFPKIVDQVGGGVLAAWIGWVMVCFTVTTLHTAPLSRNFFFASFQPKESMFFGVFAPDRQWLAFSHRVSQGVYNHMPGECFDPECRFINQQTERRAVFERYVLEAKAVRVDPRMANPGMR